jgi:hypothetical protein
MLTSHVQVHFSTLFATIDFVIKHGTSFSLRWQLSSYVLSSFIWSYPQHVVTIALNIEVQLSPSIGFALCISHQFVHVHTTSYNLLCSNHFLCSESFHVLSACGSSCPRWHPHQLPRALPLPPGTTTSILDAPSQGPRQVSCSLRTDAYYLSYFCVLLVLANVTEVAHISNHTIHFHMGTDE